jgi:hypothetical protein
MKITYNVFPLDRIVELSPDAKELFICTASVSLGALNKVQWKYKEIKRTCIVGMFHDNSTTGVDFVSQAAELGWKVGLFPTLHAKLSLVQTSRGWHGFFGSSNFSLNANNGNNLEFNVEVFFGKTLPVEVRKFKDFLERQLLTTKDLDARSKGVPRYLPVGYYPSGYRGRKE